MTCSTAFRVNQYGLCLAFPASSWHAGVVSTPITPSYVQTPTYPAMCLRGQRQRRVVQPFPPRTWTLWLHLSHGLGMIERSGH